MSPHEGQDGDERLYSMRWVIHIRIGNRAGTAANGESWWVGTKENEMVEVRYPGVG